MKTINFDHAGGADVNHVQCHTVLHSIKINHLWVMPEHARRHTAVSCTKMVKLIEMPFGLWTRVGLRKHVLGGVQTGATRRIPLNRPCAAMMRPFCLITLTSCVKSNWSPFLDHCLAGNPSTFSLHPTVFGSHVAIGILLSLVILPICHLNVQVRCHT